MPLPSALPASIIALTIINTKQVIPSPCSEGLHFKYCPKQLKRHQKGKKKTPSKFIMKKGPFLGSFLG